MFDTMTITKIGGGLCGALLVFLLLNWAAESIYSTEVDDHGESAEPAFVIEVEEEAVESAETDDEVSPEEIFAAAMAEADTAKGSKVFSKCKACHKLEEGKKGVGPTLFGIHDRDIASLDGFKYSSALTDLEGNWTAFKLNEFITDPKAFATGTKMKFKGLKKVGDRANLISFLATVGN